MIPAILLICFSFGGSGLAFTVYGEVMAEQERAQEFEELTIEADAADDGGSTYSVKVDSQGSFRLDSFYPISRLRLTDAKGRTLAVHEEFLAKDTRVVLSYE